MKIKTQFINNMVIFGVMLLIIAASVIFTSQQVERLNKQEEIAKKIERTASELGYLSNDYLLYHESQQRARWESKFSSLSDDLSNLNPNSPEQQALVNNIRANQQRLKAVFTDVVSTFENTSQNQSDAADMAFQTAWSRMTIQNQGMAFDAERLAQTLRDQAHQLEQTNITLIFVLLGIFGAYFLTNYLIVYRRALKSISDLQDGTRIIGSGNLDYFIKTNREDEVGELSRAFNQMTADLKGVTASKTELEREVTERKQVEEALRESRQRYATTLASIGDAVIATDVEGSITFMNAVAEELTGWSLAEASTKPVTEVFNIINEYTRREADNPVSRVLQEGTVVGLANHTILVRKDGTEVSIDDSGAPIRDRDGKTMGVVLVFRDITRRKRTEEALRSAESKFRILVEQSLAGIYITQDKKIIYVNPKLAEILGYTQDEIISSKSVSDLIVEEDSDRAIENIRKRLRGEVQSIQQTFKGKRKDGTFIDLEVHGTRTELDGKTVVIGTALDITERKQAEEALRKAHDQLETRVQERTMELEETNARYRELSESINEIFFAMDKDLKYTYWNKLSEALTGVSAKDAIGKSLYELFPDVKGTKVERFYIEALKTQQSRRFVNEYTLGGRNYIFEVNVYPSKGGISVIAKDITERKRAEEHLKESLKEKEILLKEVHHRVKNNMQVISSLLMLQEDSSEDKKIIEMLKDSQNRISSMALIHERLYRSGNLSKVDLKEYVDDLVSGLFQSYGVSESRVALNINVENVLLGIDSAIPCGLVINELVSNSLKHAFPGDKKGEINIFLRLADENMVELVVGDNGIGIPEDMDIRKTKSLGLYLVTLLVENQLHGEITLNRQRVTEFLIKFRGMK